MSLIKASHLRKVYESKGGVETVALDDISLEISLGEFVSIMGPSGSGKSTLLHILGFLDRQTSGTYLFNDRSIDSFSEEQLAHVRNKKMGFVFQSFNLLARTSVLDNIKLPLYYSGVGEEKWDDMALEAIESVGLSKRIKHEPSQLSGGEKQKVAIARALVNKPDIIFADEPTGNLDSQSGEQIMGIISALHSKGHTIILITHETYTAEYADRIVSFHDGKIKSDKKVEQENKTHKFIK